MGSPVSLMRVKKSDEIKSAISEALGLINFKLDKHVQNLVIKPNLCYYWAASTGYTTDPRLVAGVIDVMRENYGKDLDIKVVEADATAMRTKHAFQMLGYTKLAEAKKVELHNLSEGVLLDKAVKVNGREFTFEVPRLLLEADLFVNVPKLKIMKRGGVSISCALKNLFGCIGSQRKIVYHPHLSEAIVGISQVLKPHLTIVDGLVALGRHPVRLDLIMVGTDPFSIDWAAAQIVGCNPYAVKFLKIARKEKLGEPKDITLKGEDMETFRKSFPKENFFPSTLWWNTQLKLLKFYNKIVGDTVPKVLEGA